MQLLLLTGLLLAGTPSVRVDPNAPGIEVGDTAKPEERDTILKAVDQGLVPVRACWHDTLEKRSRLRGSVLLVFTVLPDGSVSKPVVKDDSLNEKKTLDCLIRKISEIHVALSGEQTVRVVVPVSFRNGADPAVSEKPGATPAGESLMQDDIAAIDKRLAEESEHYRGCHNAALKRDPTIAGTIIVDFTLEENADVRTATVSGGSIASHSMMECMANAIRSTRFEKPQSGRITLRRTFTFDGTSKVFSAERR